MVFSDDCTIDAIEIPMSDSTTMANIASTSMLPRCDAGKAQVFSGFECNVHLLKMINLLTVIIKLEVYPDEIAFSGRAGKYH